MRSEPVYLHPRCILGRLVTLLLLAATTIACAGVNSTTSVPTREIAQNAPSAPDSEAAASLPSPAPSPFPGPAYPTVDEDPLEPLNRFFYGVNFVVDHTLLRPLALAYRAGVPNKIKTGVSNLLRNLKSPIVILNDTLQGNWEDAGRTTLRLVINSTVGFFGLFDVAADGGLPYHSNGFGQTLAVYGVGRGPYLFVPLRGPINPRDLIGLGVDSMIDPLSLYLPTTDYASLSWIRTGASGFNDFVDTVPLLQDVEQTALDPYSTIRRFYLYAQQRRDAKFDTAREKAPPTLNEDVPGSEFDF